MQGLPTHLVELLINEKRFFLIIPQKAALDETKLVIEHVQKELDQHSEALKKSQEEAKVEDPKEEPKEEEKEETKEENDSES